MDGSLVGRSFAQVEREDLPALLVQRVARIRSKKIAPAYLKVYICSKYFTDHCDKVKTVTAIPHISPADIRSFRIPLPPTIAEQTAIATALSDADALIQSLEKLIAKKRLIKQGAMQELLRPKEGWEVKKLGELGKFRKGKGIKKDQVQNEGLPCIRYGELYTHFEDKIEKVNSFINEKVSKSSVIIKYGDICFAGSGETREEIGKCATYCLDRPGFAGGDIVIFSSAKVDPIFLGYLLNSSPMQELKSQKGQGDAVVHISARSLESMEISIPKRVEEQTRIATILSDMDAEIEALETKLEKYLQIKQGMMQELLTGKTRLV